MGTENIRSQGDEVTHALVFVSSLNPREKRVDRQLRTEVGALRCDPGMLS